MNFSQRIGKVPAPKLVQREVMDEDLRNSLWSVLTVMYWETYSTSGSDMYGRSDYVRGSNMESLIISMWLYYFKQPIDTIDEYWEHCLEKLRKRFLHFRDTEYLILSSLWQTTAQRTKNNNSPKCATSTLKEKTRPIGF